MERNAVAIYLTTELEGGDFAPRNQFHVRPEQVEFRRDGYVQVTEGENKVLIPPHQVDHIEIG